VLFLDADERVAPGDADAVRALVEEADPGHAYGFEIHRATDDLGLHDPAGRWVYRLFRRQPGQAFPDKRLHFVPVPADIPRRRYLRTSIRLLHVATTTSEDGAHRIAKYREADADRRWQASYDHLAAPPGALIPVPPRQGPLVLPIHARTAAGPALSAIVISRDDEDRIERCVRSVVEQEVREPFEVIVVTSGTDGTAEVVRREFPDVCLVELDRPALPGQARNAGLAVATGDVIAFPSSHITLAPGSLHARLDAHRDGWAMVTGVVLNGNTTRPGWATYLLDHSSLRRRHHERGRAWAAILLHRHGSRWRVVWRAWRHLIGYLPRRLWRIRRNVRAWGEGLGTEYRRSWPLIAQGAAAAWWGLLTGVVKGEAVRHQPVTSHQSPVTSHQSER